MVEKNIIAFYENPIDLLEFLRDVAKVNKNMNFGEDVDEIVWKEEFEFIYDEINHFLNRRNIK